MAERSKALDLGLTSSLVRKGKGSNPFAMTAEYFFNVSLTPLPGTLS